MNQVSTNLTVLEPANVSNVLVVMKNLHDRQFASAWLVKMMETQWAWRETLHNPAFEQLALIWMGKLDLGDFGQYLVSSIWRHDRIANLMSFDLESHPHFDAEFAILVELGFFVLSGQFYNPAIPETITDEAVQQAGLKVASTATGAGKRRHVDPKHSLRVFSKFEVDAMIESLQGGRRRWREMN
jgi:hypothetical protein